MTENGESSASFEVLKKATTLLLLYQAAFMLSQVFGDAPHTGAMTAILAATITLSAVNQRLHRDAQGQHAKSYIMAWRVGVLLFVGFLTAVVSLRAYVPEAAPEGIPTVFVMLATALVGLKGALFGKLKPGGVLGLRLRWTCQSRLAWERAHRSMGRILFFGSLIMLAATPFVDATALAIGLGAIILIGLTAGIVTSYQVWRVDPERLTPG